MKTIRVVVYVDDTIVADTSNTVPDADVDLVVGSVLVQVDEPARSEDA